MQRLHRQTGFTLIELIAVIVVLGVIAAVAVPRFVDLSNAARQASVQNMAASLNSGSSLNYAAHIAALRLNQSGGVAPPVEVIECSSNGVDRLLEFGLPEGFLVEPPAGGTAAVNDLEAIPCEVVSTQDSTIRARFTLFGVNPT